MESAVLEPDESGVFVSVVAEIVKALY